MLPCWEKEEAKDAIEKIMRDLSERERREVIQYLKDRGVLND